MGNKIMQETTPLVECSAFHRGMSVLEASLRNTEDSETIISGLLKGAAEFYGASRASVVEADWDLGIGVITYEWCKDGVSAQRDMLQCLPMEKFPRWRKALRANKPVVISDLQRLENVYPDEAAFFREYGVTTLLAAPFSKRINQGFIAVDDPTRYTDDPVFLFIASYAVVVELNEIKQQQSLLAATKASKYNPEDIHINFFGGMEIISSKGTLTGEDIKADQCYLLLAYLILNHKKNSTVDTLAEIICPYDELDSPYKVVNNIVYRLRRTLSVIGLDMRRLFDTFSQMRNTQAIHCGRKHIPAIHFPQPGIKILGSMNSFMRWGLILQLSQKKPLSRHSNWRRNGNPLTGRSSGVNHIHYPRKYHAVTAAALIVEKNKYPRRIGAVENMIHP